MSININKKNKTFYQAPLLRDVTININHGLYHLTGPNGSGKSTFLKLLTGFEKFDDKTSINENTNTLFLTVDPVGVAPFSLKENIEIIWNTFGQKLTKNKIESIKKLFNIDLNTSYGKASTGTKSKIGLSLLFSKQWDNIYIDETLSALDTDSVNFIAKELYKQSKKAVVIYVFHNLNNDFLNKNSKTLAITGGKIIEKQ